MEPISVAVSRGSIVEAIHRVHAVAVKDGAVVAEAGDPSLVAFMRSSSKPLQALPLARVRDDLDHRDLAIASASHLADDDQLTAVRALLAKAPARVDDHSCACPEVTRETISATRMIPPLSASIHCGGTPPRVSTFWIV